MMRKAVLALAAGAVFACASSNNEITGVVGGVHPFSDSELKNHLTYGLRIGAAVNTLILDQLEVGYDYSHDVDYKQSKYDTSIHRIYFNGLKEFQIASKTKLYGLVGVGYEDLVNDDVYEDEDSGAFGQYGVGIKQYFGDHIALRGEVRHAIKFDDGHKNYLFYTLGLVVGFGASEQPVVIQKEEPVAEVKPVEEPKVEEAPKVVEEPKVVVAEPKVEPVETINEKDIQGTVVKKISLTNKNFNFDVNSAKVDAEGDKVLQGIADDIKSDSSENTKILVGGHTDSTGSAAYNLKLSQQRAESVKDKLVAKGVSADKIITRGYGDTRPVATNKTAAGRTANRRVDIIFVNQDK